MVDVKPSRGRMLAETVMAGAAVGMLVYAGARGTGICRDISYPDDGDNFWRMGTECGDWTTLYLSLEVNGRGISDEPGREGIRDYSLSWFSGGGGTLEEEGFGPDWRLHTIIGSEDGFVSYTLFALAPTPFGEVRIMEQDVLNGK